MWDWFINFLTMVLEGLHGVSGDWGLAVIILTLIIRLILTPLQTKSVKSTANMQVMQPKIAEIQEKYADDPVRMQEEQMKLYSEANFNPIMGCPASLPADAHLLRPLHRREERACGCLLLRYSAVHLRFRRWRACRLRLGRCCPLHHL